MFCLVDRRVMDAPDVDQLIGDVGRKVAELRAVQGWTQAELAERADVSLKYIQRVEAGQENLTIRSLARFAELLGVEIVALFTTPDSRDVRLGRPARKDQ